MVALKTSLFTQLLREFGEATIVLGGCSMIPALRPGDAVRVQAGDIAIGDIVVFLRGDHLCAHRLLSVANGQAIARGDANRKLDDPFPVEQILGRVISLQRQGTHVHDLAYSPVLSFIVRNSSISRRVLLKLYQGRTRLKMLLRPELIPTSSKFEA